VVAGAVVVSAAGGVVLAGASPPQAAKVRARAKAAGTSRNLDIKSPYDLLGKFGVQAEMNVVA
jgi:hypothetical protein